MWKPDWLGLMKEHAQRQTTGCKQKGAAGHLQQLPATCAYRGEVMACLATPTSLAVAWSLTHCSKQAHSHRQQAITGTVRHGNRHGRSLQLCNDQVTHPG